MGYNTITGENGFGISGGQKQRVLLARALYRQLRLLVRDEATSHLDLNNEKAVNATVQAMGLTRVIAAHRPDTIAMADREAMVKDRKLHNESNNNRLTRERGSLHTAF